MKREYSSMTHAYMNWSGGKDSSLCLQRVLEEGQLTVDYLLTSVNAFHNRISMHGVRRELLEAQARSIGIPLQTVELTEQPGMIEYEQTMQEKVSWLKEQGCAHALFGDIFLEDLRRYREEKLRSLDISCLFPLWQIPTPLLLDEFLQKGFKAMIVCVNEKYLGKDFCGRFLDESFVRDLPANVDPCGENGEYHSFVFDGPIFREPIPFVKGEIVYREYKAPEGTTSSDPKTPAPSLKVLPEQARSIVPEDAAFASPCTPMDQPSKTGFYFCDLLPG